MKLQPITSKQGLNANELPGCQWLLVATKQTRVRRSLSRGHKSEAPASGGHDVGPATLRDLDFVRLTTGKSPMARCAASRTVAQLTA